MKNRSFSKTLFLTRFAFKRDWLKLVIWSGMLIAMFVGVAAKFTTLYGSKSSIDEIIKTLKTPAMISLFGKMPNGPYTSADVFASEMTVFMAILAAIMNYSIMVKNTRGEEDSGILEIIQAHSVGRLANLSPALIELFITNLVIGLIYSIGLNFANLSGTNTNGNFLLGLGLGASGFMFACIAALLSQLVDNSRNAAILSYIVFGIMYILRMMTDVSNPKLTWYIPLGWVEKFSTYKNNNWLPVLLMLFLSLILIIISLWINNQRDITSGIIATRPGRKNASVLLSGPLGLLQRLNRTTIIIWIVGLLILGSTYGSIFNTIGDIVKTNPTFGKLLGESAQHSANVLIIKNFVAVLMIVFGVLALIPGIQIINYLKTGENKGYLEMIHAKPISRSRLFFSSLFLASVTTLVVLFAAILGLYLGDLAVMKDPISLNIFLRGFYAYISPVMIMLGIAVFIVGIKPQLINLSYLYLGLSLFIQYFGKLMDLPKWVSKVTPFGYIPRVPVHKLDPGTFWWQILIAVILITLGYLGYRQRDLIGNK